jgi:dihydroxyacetone kinase-like protein
MLQAMVEQSAERIAVGSEELCALDWAIGDGDHSANMKRGWDAVRDRADEFAGMPTG